MPKGNYTALQKLKPIQVDWAKAAKSGNEREDLLYNRKKAEEKLAQDKRDKIDFEAQEAVVTGIDSLDMGLTLGIEEASTMQHSDFIQAREDANYADSSKYKIRNKNLNNYSKNVKNLSDGMTKLAQEVIGMASSGTLAAWDDELLQTMNGIYTTESTKFGVNPDGSVKTTIALTDQALITDDNPRGFVKDANGRVKMKTVTPSEVFKGLGGFSITPEVDIQKQATDIGKELGKSIDMSIKGYDTKSEQSWETKKEETREIVKGLLGTPSALTPLAKRLWGNEMGKDSRKLTASDMVEMEEVMLAKIQPFYDEEVKKTRAFTARETARKNAQDKTANNVSPEFVPTKDGSPEVIQINGVDANTISFGGGEGIMVIGTEAKKESIQNIYVDANGDIFADKIIENKYKGDPIYLDGKPKTDENIDWVTTMSRQKAKGWENVIENKVPLTLKDFNNLSKNPKLVDDKGETFKDGHALRTFLKDKKAKLPKAQNNVSEGDVIFDN